METKGWEMQRRVRRVRKCVVTVLPWVITGLAQRVKLENRMLETLTRDKWATPFSLLC
jgi:hypothetical protein